MIEERKILMMANGKTELEITMNSPIVDIAESNFVGEFWVFIN